MIEPLIDLPAHLRLRLAAALSTGALAEPYSTMAVRSTLGTQGGEDAVCAALASLAAHGIQPLTCASWLTSIERSAAGTSRPDLVWSGPEVPGVHARNTRRVYEELLGSATRSILACTFAYFDGQRAFDTLARRMDAMPDLKVTLLLNIQRKRGDTTEDGQLVRQFADRFWKLDWPGKARPSAYYDPRSLDSAGPAGVLHAKALVIDEAVLFVTSANLTEAALDRNIELGLLTRDRALALAATSHFHGLIDRGLLQPLPGA